jgi:hypothetical protein
MRLGSHDTQLNGPLYNATQHNNIENMAISRNDAKVLVVMLSAGRRYAICCYAGCHFLGVTFFMLSVFM